jgi:glycosyltransferase involved in cell wall biosynthesis
VPETGESELRGAGERPLLYVLKRFPRVSETFVLNELLALEERGERIVVDALLAPEEGPRHPELERLRAPVRYLPRYPRLGDRRVALAHLRVGIRFPRRWLRLARTARRTGTWRRFLQAGLVARRVKRERARHIHAHFATAAAEVARDAASLAGVPFTVTAHAKDIFKRENARLLRSRLDGAAAVVTISEFNADHLRKVLAAGVPVRHVPNGMPLPAPAPPSPDGPVLCVARLIPKKGVDVLIEACALLADELPGLRAEIVGDGPLAGELLELARKRGIEDRVDFLGALASDEVDAALRRSSLVALPCRIAADGDRDGIPTVLLEAMARGIPVVSTRIGGIPEVVRDRATGLLVDPDSPRELAGAISSLAGDRSRAESLGAGGRSLIRERFDPRRSATLLESVFEEAQRV